MKEQTYKGQTFLEYANEAAGKIRKIAEERKLLRLNSGKDYDLEVVADEFVLHDDTVRCMVSGHIKEISSI